MRAVIYFYARDDDHADDLLQESWVQILERLDGFTGRGSFAGWALVVTKNVCKMKLRQEKRASDTVPLEKIGEVASHGLALDEELRRRRQEQAVYSALGRLPERERDTIVLRLFEGRSTAETATILGISKTGVASIVHRGISRLRRMEEVRELLLEWMGSG